jgi:hypothetical protein
VKGVLCDLSS